VTYRRHLRNTPSAFNLGSLLVRRGHRVRMQGWAPMVVRVVAAGIEFTTYPTTAPARTQPIWSSHSRARGRDGGAVSARDARRVAMKKIVGAAELRCSVVHRVAVISIPVEDVLVHGVALLRVWLSGELFWEAVQGLLNGDAHR
jgi:hypothetical protein